MYVCICNQITEKDIREAAASGLTSLEDLREHLNVSGNCGSCAEHAQACLAEALPGTVEFFAAPQFATA